MDWNNVIIVIVAAVWTLILTAPIHCRGSIVSFFGGQFLWRCVFLPVPEDTMPISVCTDFMSCWCCLRRAELLVLAALSCLSRAVMAAVWLFTRSCSPSFSSLMSSSSVLCFDSRTKTLLSKRLVETMYNAFLWKTFTNSLSKRHFFKTSPDISEKFLDREEINAKWTPWVFTLGLQ